MALSFAAQSYEGVALCQLTLGATAEGVFAETLALSASWSLPVVFLVTHDLAADAPAPAVTELFQRSAASGVAGLKCSGVDPVEVRECVAEAARRARDERHPTLVEAVVRRAGDSAVDPVAAFGERLVAEGALAGEERDAIEAGVRDRLDAATETAVASPEPQRGVTRELTYREALREALRGALAEDDRVIVLGQDVGARGGSYGVTAGLLKDFGAGRVLRRPRVGGGARRRRRSERR